MNYKNFVFAACAYLLSAVVSVSAWAEEEIFTLKPLKIIEDPNGVDLLSGKYRPQLPPVAIPAASNLHFDNVEKFAAKIEGKLLRSGRVSEGTESYSVTYGGSTSDSFTCRDECESFKFNGSMLFGNAKGASFQYRQGHSGLKIIFDQQSYRNTFPDGEVADHFVYYASQMIYPSGETLTLHYDTAPDGGKLYHRPASVVSNLGYTLQIRYQSDDLVSGDWGKVVEAAIYRTGSVGQALARKTYAGATVTDELNRTWTGFKNQLGSSEQLLNVNLRNPGASVDYMATQAESRDHGLGVHSRWITSVTNAGASYQYDYTAVTYPDVDASAVKLFSKLTISGPQNYSAEIGVKHSPVNRIPLIEWSKDPMGQVTAYGYDDQQRLTQITYPEDNVEISSYDELGNVTELRLKAKPGSNVADIVVTAHYDTLGCSGIRCFRPVWSKDAKGNQTDYTYAAHGGLLTKLEPVDSEDRRRKTINEYETTPAGLHRVKRQRICTVDSNGNSLTCGTEDELVTEFTYWQSTFLPETVTQTNGTGSLAAVTHYTYDAAGRELMADGPLPGTDDATYARYDAAGRKTWDIGPRTQQGTRLATRISYRDADDQPYLIEKGTVLTPDDTQLQVFQKRHTAYDDHGKKLHDSLEAGGIIRSLQQYSYDSANRLRCSVQRMNPALYASLPASACSLGGAGVYGADRVTRHTYDAAGRITETITGYGTPEAGVERAMGYTANGQVDWREDGNRNRTNYTYDGFDRLTHTTFPDSSQEINSYDVNGNVRTTTKRDGRVLIHDYDSRNQRVATRSAGENDWLYGYDGLGRPTRFVQGSYEITQGYDPLGRLDHQVIGGRQLGFQHDIAGRRTRLTHPDGFFLEYRWDATGQVTDILENGTHSLVSYQMDNRGRVDTVDRGNGQQTAYGYDVVGRVEQIDHSLINTMSFSFNPAHQQVSRTVTSSVFKHPLPAAGVEVYDVNNLNQYSAVAGQAFDYDANGNLTEGKGWTYQYDVMNRLTSASGDGTSLALGYDPQGRLASSSHNGSETQFLYDGDALIAEYDSNGQLLRRYVHGAGVDDPLLWYEGTGLNDKRYLLADERGSIVAQTDDQGRLSAVHTYGVFGEPGDDSAARFRYTGQILLPGTELYHYKARVYSPELGRFLQTDPIGYEDQMNLYAYVGNDPIGFVDPSGLVRLNLSAGVQFVPIHGGRLIVGVSFDFDTGEVGANATVGVRSGASGGLEGSITFSESEKLGNRASTAISANADAGYVIRSEEVPLASGEISTKDGMKNTSGGKVSTMGVDFEDSKGGKGIVVKPKLGVSAGVDLSAGVNLSIPDTMDAIVDGLGQLSSAVDDFVETCSKNPC